LSACGETVIIDPGVMPNDALLPTHDREVGVMIVVRSSARRALLFVRLVHHIQAEDFALGVMPAVEQLCVREGRIACLLIDVREFHGWGAVGAFAAQIRFLRTYGRRVERVALIGAPSWAGVIPAISALFVVAEIRCFVPGEGRVLRAWLRSPRPSGGSPSGDRCQQFVGR